MLAIEQPIDQDVTELVQYAAKMKKSDALVNVLR